MATSDEVREILNMLSGSFPAFGQNLGPERLAQTVSIYEQLLQDLPAADLRAAAVQHTAGNKFFPAISELRQLALAMHAPKVPTALEAWGRIEGCFNSRDYYRYEDHAVTPEFPDDPILEAVLHDLGGFWYLAQETTNIVADRKQFIDAYNQRQARAADERNLLPQVREVRDRIQAERREQVAGLLTSTGQLLRRVK